MKEWHGSSWTATELPEDGMDQDREARHDRPCLYLRLSREFNGELEVRRTATSDQNQKPDIFLPDCNQAVDVGVVQPRALNSYYKSKIDAYGKRTLPIIIGTNGVLHEKSKKHLQDFGVDIPRFMAYAVFVIEYQHHKATADYMTKITSCLKGKIAVVTDGRALGQECKMHDCQGRPRTRSPLEAPRCARLRPWGAP